MPEELELEEFELFDESEVDFEAEEDEVDLLEVEPAFELPLEDFSVELAA